MLNWFKRRSQKEPIPSLDAVRFDTSGYTFQGERQPGTLRAWFTPDGDGLGVYFFPIPPDLPAHVPSADELIAFYQNLAAAVEGKVIDARRVDAGACPAVRTILSLPNQPSGRVYVGTLTVPFQDFSFVLKCQCPESGVTGLKAALLLDRLLAESEPEEREDGTVIVPGFDPDDPQYDREFPDEPVARVRRTLDHVTRTLIVDAEIQKLPGFKLPPISA